MNGSNSWTEWQDVAFDGAKLWIESWQVIWLRSAMLARGGPASNLEAVRMVAEKVEANWQLANRLFWVGPMPGERAARHSIRHYRGKVAANRRRLGR
jgi:hypothetical protein